MRVRRGHVDAAMRDGRPKVIVPVRAVEAEGAVIGHEIRHTLQIVDADRLWGWRQLGVLGLVQDVAPVGEGPSGILTGRNQGGEDEFAVIVDA